MISAVKWNQTAYPLLLVAEAYVPELVLGHLLTGSNFDDKVASVTGGRHGYGAKLANIFSTEFNVRVHDAKRGLKYNQVRQKRHNVERDAGRELVRNADLAKQHA